MMKNNTIEYVTYLFIGLPVILTFLLYFIKKRITGNKWKAIHTTAQWTTPLYIIAVSFLLKIVFEQGFLGYILVSLILMLAIILIVQWKTKMEVILIDGLRILWRINFIFFTILYAGLIIYVTVLYIQLP